MQAHHAGDHGFGRKAPDWTAVPLCVEHHLTGSYAVHGWIGRHFWEYHGLDRDAEIRRLHEAYKQETGRIVAA